MAKQSAGARRKRTEDDPVDWFDVPAAILCAACGQADCPGCATASETESGIIAIVPWERPGAGVWSRLWSTANATTQGAETFFAVLPDGELRPAMRFAILAELLAISSLVFMAAPLLALAVPNLALEVVRDVSMRNAVLRWTAFGVPALALWMVATHAVHGAALDAGARRHGGLSQRRRALRFGLYACGWDLLRTPLGALVTLTTKGLRSALDIADLAVHAPDSATTALLQGVYKLPPQAVLRARRIGAIAAFALSIASGGAIALPVLLALLS